MTVGELPEVSARDHLLGFFNGLVELDRQALTTLDAEEETWSVVSEDSDLRPPSQAELADRLDRLQAVLRSTQLTDRQRAMTVLLSGRLRRHLRAGQ